jgi:hypothetical protein
VKNAVFQTLNSAAAIEAVVVRYCRRRIDRLLKKVDLSGAADIAGITAAYAEKTTAISIADVAQQAKDRIATAIRDGNLPLLLANYDNKGLMALAATHLKGQRVEGFESWLTRILRNDKAPEVAAAIRGALPSVQAQ